MVKTDLAIAGTRAPWKVSFSDSNLECDEMGVFQTCPDGDGEPSVIFLQRRLKPIGLYRTYLHEVGHGYGLDHFGRGIMAAKGIKMDWLDRMPTLAERSRWCRQLAKMIAGRRRLR